MLTTDTLQFYTLSKVLDMALADFPTRFPKKVVSHAESILSDFIVKGHLPSDVATGASDVLAQMVAYHPAVVNGNPVEAQPSIAKPVHPGLGVKQPAPPTPATPDTPAANAPKVS